ncbi:MAG: hypothetical protein ACTSUE_22885 [Promethearchaeota archaeon]
MLELLRKNYALRDASQDEYSINESYYHNPEVEHVVNGYLEAIRTFLSQPQLKALEYSGPNAYTLRFLYPMKTGDKRILGTTPNPNINEINLMLQAKLAADYRIRLAHRPVQCVCSLDRIGRPIFPGEERSPNALQFIPIYSKKATGLENWSRLSNISPAQQPIENPESATPTHMLFSFLELVALDD